MLKNLTFWIQFVIHLTTRTNPVGFYGNQFRRQEDKPAVGWCAERAAGSAAVSMATWLSVHPQRGGGSICAVPMSSRLSPARPARRLRGVCTGSERPSSQGKVCVTARAHRLWTLYIRNAGQTLYK